MEFNNLTTAKQYIDNVGISNLIQVDMIIGLPKWLSASKSECDYYIITKITTKFVMIKELGIAKKYIGREIGGYKKVQFRLYKQRDNKIENSWEKPKTKISIDKLYDYHLIIEKQNKKYGFISLNETYNSTEDYGF